jgi:ADP-ribose pyrophosphatase YjhB (NUDIX family)
MLVLRADRMATVRQVLADLTAEQLAGSTDPVLEPGYPQPESFPVRRCLRAILNEEWEHRLYAERDLPAFVDTVAWVHLENGRILCARPRGKDIFYIPGGKREGAETDLQTLLREIAEELTVALLPETVTHVGTYEAYQPHGHPGGAVVRMSCYAAAIPAPWRPAARSTSWPGSATPTGPEYPCRPVALRRSQGNW